jgi:hypothetical protein
MDMRDNRKLSPNSIGSHVSAIQTFLIINDFGEINWTKVKKFVGEFYKVTDDRPYTRDEIKQLVDATHSSTSYVDGMSKLSHKFKPFFF